jgi:hypothetical protein
MMGWTAENSPEKTLCRYGFWIAYKTTTVTKLERLTPRRL